MTRNMSFSFLALIFISAVSIAQDNAPQFTDDGELIRPANYREWVFLTSGLGMVYGPNAPGPNRPAPFSNVFVNPDAYSAFMQTGEWPDGTVFALEIRRAVENVSINNGGHTQGGMAALEASVKDSTRYPDGGWAYFDFNGPNGLRPAAAPLARTASCYSCHSQHGAVQWTFTQFYPEQFAVAEQKGTVREDYDPTAKVE